MLRVAGAWVLSLRTGALRRVNPLKISPLTMKALLYPVSNSCPLLFRWDVPDRASQAPQAGTCVTCRAALRRRRGQGTKGVILSFQTSEIGAIGGIGGVKKGILVANNGLRRKLLGMGASGCDFFDGCADG